MDISSARMTALLREAMILAATPAAKTDPAKTALLKALARPSAPSGAPSQPAMTSALQVLLSTAVAKEQQTGAAEILQAYLAISEPKGETSEEGRLATTASGQAGPTGDDTQRGLAVPLAARADDGGSGKPVAHSLLAFLAPIEPTKRSAGGPGAAAKPGQAKSRSNDGSEIEDRRPKRVALLALGAVLLAVAIVGFALSLFG